MLSRPIRGMKDLCGVELEKYIYVIARARRIAEKYGYTQIKTPILEYTDVFLRSIGDETDVVSKEMYTFIDKGGESLTLRPEGTAGVMRAIASRNLAQQLPLKLMYFGEMFRYDRPQRGRFRQFHQLGFEHIGDKSPFTDAIMIAMAVEILSSVGIFDIKVLVNTLGDDETRENYTKAIVKFFSRNEEALSDESKIRLKKNPLRILDSKDAGDREICAMAPLIADYLSKDSGKYFETVCKLLVGYGLNYEVDSFLVRGLDYYTHTTFELKATSANYKDSLGGGGRYDKLLGLFGDQDVSGIGFAFGMERIMLLINDDSFGKTQKKVCVIPVCDNENNAAFELFKLLQNCDLNAEFLHIGNLTKKMKVAGRMGCEMALIIGETELKNGVITVKFMNKPDDGSKTKLIDKNQIAQFVKCSIGELSWR
ncbi:histidine--tRNA ligase [Alphaproteobacteria bacterium]|nr:histidine--tRNA ligase [Alphaproteobacteria bacterium]